MGQLFNNLGFKVAESDGESSRQAFHGPFKSLLFRVADCERGRIEGRFHYRLGLEGCPSQDALPRVGCTDAAESAVALECVC